MQSDWAIERSLAWFLRACRNARDYERTPAHAEAHLIWSAITLMLRRLASGRGRQHTLADLIARAA